MFDDTTLTLIDNKLIPEDVWVGVMLFVVMFLESILMLGYFIPAVAILLLVGSLVAMDMVSLWPALLGGALGAIAGSSFSFWLGRRYGERVWQTWPLRNYPRAVRRGRRLFDRHGATGLVLGRFSKPFRSLVPALAGTSRMSTRRFMTFNSMAIMVWSPAWVFAGMGVGVSVEALPARGLLAAGLLLGLVLIGWWAYRRRSD